MSSGFITETEALEARRKRQEEWDKVRQPEEPAELPEEPYDSRSLYERLKEQKDKRDMEYEEVHKLKNMIRGLDDDEVDFLEFVDRTKLNAEKKQRLAEDKEMEEFRQRVATLQEKSHEDKLLTELAKQKTNNQSNNSDASSKRLSQKCILSSGIVLKKRKIEEENLNKKQNKLKNNDDSQIEKSMKQFSTNTVVCPSALKIIGVLPGLGDYNSESSSDSDNDNGKFDLVGRKNIKRKHDE